MSQKKKKSSYKFTINERKEKRKKNRRKKILMYHDIKEIKECVSVILIFASNEAEGHSPVKATERWAQAPQILI